MLGKLTKYEEAIISLVRGGINDSYRIPRFANERCGAHRGDWAGFQVFARMTATRATGKPLTYSHKTKNWSVDPEALEAYSNRRGAGKGA